MDGIDLGHVVYSSGKPEGARFRVAWGSWWVYYGFTPGALVLEPSGFCNDRERDKVAKFLYLPYEFPAGTVRYRLFDTFAKTVK